MKKLIAILLALTMLSAFAVSAFAETETKAELKWADAEEAALKADPDAGFYQIGDLDLYMWIPSIYLEVELTEEDVKEGYVSVLSTEDEEAMVIIATIEGEGITLEEFYQTAIEEGYEDAEIGVINGIEALMYSDEEEDAANVICYLKDSGNFLQISFYPFSDETYGGLASLMIHSLQPEK